jgi:hypothetical protein
MPSLVKAIAKVNSGVKILYLEIQGQKSDFFTSDLWKFQERTLIHPAWVTIQVLEVEDL